ncbi:MAG: hypothetical protein ACOX6U_03280 [Oscillospiraceae bacterium]|jgi:hypothetical protein
MKKIVGVLFSMSLVACMSFTVFSANEYDYRTDLPTPEETEQIIQLEPALQITAESLGEVSNYSMDFSTAVKRYYFDIDSLKDFINQNGLQYAIENSGIYSYVFPIAETSSAYVAGIVGKASNGEFYAEGISIPRENPNRLGYAFHPDQLMTILEQNGLSSPDFIAPISILSEYTDFIYVVKNKNEVFIPYNEIHIDKLNHAEIYTKDEVVAYLENLQEQAVATSANGETLYGGNGGGGTKSYKIEILSASVLFVILIASIYGFYKIRHKGMNK